MLDIRDISSCPSCADIGSFDGYNCINCGYRDGDEAFCAIISQSSKLVNEIGDLVDYSLSEKKDEKYNIVLGEKITSIKTVRGNLGFTWNGYNVVSNPSLARSIVKITKTRNRVRVSDTEFFLIRKIITELGRNPQNYGIDGLKFFSS